LHLSDFASQSCAVRCGSRQPLAISPHSFVDLLAVAPIFWRKLHEWIVDHGAEIAIPSKIAIPITRFGAVPPCLVER
jgi:hypothetical protein